MNKVEDAGHRGTYKAEGTERRDMNEEGGAG